MHETKTEELIEDPERGTAGLTSAIQLVDTTDSVTFDTSNSSSALPEYLAPVPFPREKEEPREFEITVFKPLVFKPRSFKQALKDSIKKNRRILEKLAEY